MKPLSRRRAAAQLGIAASTLAALEAKGTAPRHTRFGNTVRYAVADLDVWRAAHTVEAGQ
jgi:hypothetical protein